MQLDEKIIWVSWAILAAGFLQFGVQALVVRRLLPASPVPHAKDPEAGLILQRMAPAALGAAVTQVNVLIDRLLAFWVADYGPAALSYSERLIYLPLGLFATALGTILLPEFSGQVQRKDREALGATLNRSLRVLTFIMLPAAVGLGILATPIVHLVYERGEFDTVSTLQTSRALLLYAPGLLVFSLAKIFVPIFHAHGDTKTPMRIGVIAVVANLGFNLLFITLFPEGWKHAGLAAGTVLSVTLQVTVLAVLAHHRHAPLHGRSLLLSWGKQSLACAAMAFSALFLMDRLETIPELPLLISVIAGSAFIYFAATWVLRCPEWKELRHH
jgi:putative peptidoglycan lipid II flippase